MRGTGSERRERPRRGRYWVAAVGGLARNPSLWPTAVRQAARMSRPGWWRRPPFIPLPDREYLRFRLETQYGRDGLRAAAADPDDLLVYLRWCRAGSTGPPGRAA
jgi:hypothetical protein